MDAFGVAFTDNGRLELMGTAEAEGGTVLLYGAAPEEPGFLRAPLMTRLNIP